MLFIAQPFSSHPSTVRAWAAATICNISSSLQPGLAKRVHRDDSFSATCKPVEIPCCCAMGDSHMLNQQKRARDPTLYGMLLAYIVCAQKIDRILNSLIDSTNNS